MKADHQNTGVMNCPELAQVFTVDLKSIFSQEISSTTT